MLLTRKLCIFHNKVTMFNNDVTSVSYNYFPVDASTYIQENGTAGRQLTINIDRAEGGGSLKNGELQLMVHRRLLYDDSRGVGEPLNETGTTGLGLVVTG